MHDRRGPFRLFAFATCRCCFSSFRFCRLPLGRGTAPRVATPRMTHRNALDRDCCAWHAAAAWWSHSAAVPTLCYWLNFGSSDVLMAIRT